MQSKLSASKNYEETNNLGICLKKPFNISYATVGARIRLYSNWTKSSPKPVVLADAGFYHTGTEDVVQCFYNCGLKLRSWDVFDEPWVEHARHGKQCPNVTNVKVNEFSKRLEKRLNDHIEEDRAPSKQVTKQSLYSDDLIYTTAAKAFLSMRCYKDKDIKDSIKLYVTQNDTLDFSASDILKIRQNRSCDLGRLIDSGASYTTFVACLNC